MKLSLYATISLLLLPLSAEAGTDTDVLYTKKGEEYVGRLSTVSADSVVFEHVMEGGMAFALPDVQRVELGRSRPGDMWRTIEEIDDPVLLEALENAPSEEEFPNAGHVTIYRETAYRLNRGGSSDVTSRKIQKVFKERGKAVANNTLYYLSSNSRGRIDFGRTITAEGEVVPLSDAAIQDGSVFAAYPEYRDLNKKQSALKKVREGSIIDYQTTVHEEGTSTLWPFLATSSLGDREPARKIVLSVTVPEEVDCTYQMLRFESDWPSSLEQLGDGFVRYTWIQEDTEELEPENFMPTTNDLWPRVAIAPKTTWDDLGREYASVVASVSPGEEIVRTVAELIEGRSSRWEKAEAIYTFMIKEIRTIPVPYSLYSRVPQDINEVFARKYGNDLDKTVLFLAMLRQAEIPANLCLIVPQSHGALMDQVPSLGHFSDCLVRIEGRSGILRRILRRGTPESECIYTSVLDEKMPFGDLDAGYQHVQGLRIDRKDSRLIRTPLLPADREAALNRADVEIAEDGTFTVEESTRYTGGTAASIRGFKVLREEEVTKRIQAMVAGIHPNAEMITYEMSDLEDLDVPVELTVTYRITDYPLRAGEKLMAFHLPNLEYSAQDVGKQTRVHPLDWSSRTRTTNRYTLRLPEGFTVYHLPDDVSYDIPLLSYTAGFETKDGTIVFTDEYLRRHIEAPAEIYPEFKKGIETRAKLSKEWIVLERME